MTYGVSGANDMVGAGQPWPRAGRYGEVDGDGGAWGWGRGDVEERRVLEG